MKCEPGANEFIERVFSDCIYSAKDMASFVFGLSSIALWVFAAIPQFVSNVQNQSSEALSVWFLTQASPFRTCMAVSRSIPDSCTLQWFLGDTLNLLGCLVQGQQLATTVYLAMYFMLIDVVMLVQFIYYAALVKRNARIKLLSSRRRKKRRDASLSSMSWGSTDESGLASPLISQSLSRALFSTPSLPSMPVIDEEAVEEGNEGEEGEGEETRCPSPPDPPPPPPPSPYPYSAAEGSTYLDPKPHLDQEPGYLGERSLGLGSDDAPSPSPSPSPSSPSLLSTSATTLGLFGSAFALSLALSQPLISPSQSSSPFGIGLHGWSAWGFHPPSYTSSSPLLSTTQMETNTTLSIPWSNAPFDFFHTWCNSDDPSGDYHYGPLPPPSPFNPDPLPWWCDVDEVRRVAGTGLGYAATLLYLGSRVSQIIQTLSRRSAEGLSLLMFCLTVTANLCTGCSILLRVKDTEQLKAQLPWIAGTLGTVGLDVTLTSLAMHYQRLTRRQQETSQVTLPSEINVS